MADYTVTAAKLQELNELINEGGQIPTAVNDATGKTAAFIDQGKLNEAKASNLNASKQNDKSGAAWTEIQKWHDSVKSSTAPPVTPPPELPPPGSYFGVPAPQGSGNLTIPNMVGGVDYGYQIGYDGAQTGYSRAGAMCNVAWGPTQGSKANVGQAGLGSSIIFGNVPAGSFVTMWLTDVQDPYVNALYSAQIAH